MVSEPHIALVPDVRAELEQRRRNSELGDVYDVLDSVRDPEVPVLSIWDLGVLQEVKREAGRLVITITPTYSGCPAMGQIESDIVAALSAAGYEDAVVETRLSPAWSSDWLSVDARRRLRAYGVAPPDDVSCPQCGSTQVAVISEFGSTACKALYRCRSCGEPFDHFKRI